MCVWLAVTDCSYLLINAQMLNRVIFEDELAGFNHNSVKCQHSSSVPFTTACAQMSAIRLCF